MDVLHVTPGFVIRCDQHNTILEMVAKLVEGMEKDQSELMRFRKHRANLFNLLLMNFWPGPTAHHQIALDPTGARRKCEFNEARFVAVTGKSQT